MPQHHTYYFPKTVDAWKKEVMKAVEVIKLKGSAMTEVAGDEKSNVPAGIFILLAGLAMALNSYVFPISFMGITYRPGIDTVLIQAVIYAVCSAAGIFVLDFVSRKLFKGKGKSCELFRTCGYASLLGVAGILPVAGLLAGLWMLAIYFNALKNVEKLDDGSAVGAMVVSIVAVVVIFGAIGMVSGGMMFGGGMMSGWSY